MKGLVFLTLTLVLALSCTTRDTKQVNASVSPTSVNEVANISKETATTKTVPQQWKQVDFQDFSYPTSPRGNVRLKNGKIENSDRIGGSTVELKAVNYIDLNGDGSEDAVVHLVQVICGGSCDGGSDFFYFYAIKQGKPTPLSRIESGSLGYGCGLKSFTVSHQEVSLEVFWECHRKGFAIEADHDSKENGKFEAKSFTRFLFKFKGSAFALAKREVFPWPAGDVRGYTAAIRIGDE